MRNDSLNKFVLIEELSIITLKKKMSPSEMFKLRRVFRRILMVSWSICATEACDFVRGVSKWF